MIPKLDFSTATSGQIEKDFCRNLEQLRLSKNLTQKELAERAGISLRTVQYLEKGAGSSFETVLRALIALGAQNALATVLPDTTIRPMERIRLRGGERKRASRRAKSDPAPWSWEDGKDLHAS